MSLLELFLINKKHFATDSWSETGNNLYGCLKQMYLLKQSRRNLKVLLSVGGWTYSQSGHFSFVTSASSRATFVANAVTLIEDYGFDGIDLDFEYPSSAAQGQGFASLYTELRTAFNSLAASKGDTTPYLLSAAVSAGADNYANLVIPEMNTALDFWNLMAYDYAGSWLTWSDNQANLYGGAKTNVSTDAAIKHFTSAGATMSKINMGIPLYGRSFEGTAGLGQSFTGVGADEGTYAYKVLPLAGSTVYENSTDVTSYSYSASAQELVSYDTPNIVKTKIAYINSNGMAGAMYWELAKDKTGADALVAIGATALGSLDTTQNHLNYPNSKWDNIRNQMGAGTGSGTTAPASTTTKATTTTIVSTPTTSNPSSTTTVSSGTCAGVAAWSATGTYVGGDQATYGGKLYQASYWTYGDVPGGAAGVWVVVATC